MHGDIHASNIVIMPNGSLKLIDFGLATYTKSFFMSPEELLQYVMREHNKEQKLRALSAGLLRCLYSEKIYIEKKEKKSIMQENGTLNFSPLFDIFCMLVVIVKSYLILNKFISTSKTIGYYRQQNVSNVNTHYSQVGGLLAEEQINDDFLILETHLQLINSTPIIKHYNLAKIIAQFYRSIDHSRPATMVGINNSLRRNDKKLHEKNDFFVFVRDKHKHKYQSPEDINPQDHQRQFTELIKFINSQLN